MNKLGKSMKMIKRIIKMVNTDKIKMNKNMKKQSKIKMNDLNINKLNIEL